MTKASSVVEPKSSVWFFIENITMPPMISAPTMPILTPNKKQIAPRSAQIAKERSPAKLCWFSRCLLRSRSKPINRPQPNAEAKVMMTSDKAKLLMGIALKSKPISQKLMIYLKYRRMLKVDSS